MTLFVLAIAYMIGVWGGDMMARSGMARCDVPAWSRLSALAL
jgi:hypothetical protein